MGLMVGAALYKIEIRVNGLINNSNSSTSVEQQGKLTISC